MYPDELHQVLAAVVGERHDVVVTETEDQMRPSSGSILKATSDSQFSSSPRPAPVEIDDRSACRCRPPGNPHTSDRMWRVGYQDLSRLARNAIAPPARGFGFPRTQDISCLVLPIPVHPFLGDRFPSVRSATDFLWRRRLTTQILHRARSCHTRRIAARRCLSAPRNSLNPPCTLRRQYLGRLSAKEILVALQAFLDDSIFSSEGYSGVFWRRMSFGTRSASTCPGPFSISSMLLAATMNQKSLIGQTVNLSQTL